MTNSVKFDDKAGTVEPLSIGQQNSRQLGISDSFRKTEFVLEDFCSPNIPLLQRFTIVFDRLRKLGFVTFASIPLYVYDT